MHVHYKFGLLLISLLNKSTHYARAGIATNQSSSYYDYADDYDDYYDEDEGGKIIDKALRLKTTTPPPTIMAKPLFPLLTLPNMPSRSNRAQELQCPKECTCFDNYKVVKCSHNGLTEVPQGLPITALVVDLSHNKISELRSIDFQNCTKVREINLSNNYITTIDKKIFRSLKHLQHLNLASNQLTHLQPTAFSEAIDLNSLDLSNNSLTLSNDGPFLNQPSLLELSCSNCSWTHIHDNTFTNMSALTALDLDRNHFSKKINTNAFRPLKYLIKLKLPQLDYTAIENLCNILKSIDKISFKHFDISCYELVLGTSFNESIILATASPYKQATLPTKPMKPIPAVIRADIQNSDKQAFETTTSESMPSTQSVLNTTMEGTNNTENILRSGLDHTELTAATHTDGSNDEKAYQVPISQETINYMLICIMIIAVIGLTIGIICRKDLGGIKTKCCRTNKPEPKDHVHPAEEIPLNKLA